MRYENGDYTLWQDTEVLILEVYEYSKKALIQDTLPNDFGEYDSRLVPLDELGETTYDLDIPEPEAMIDVIAKAMNSVMPSEYWCLAVLGSSIVIALVKHLIMMIM